MPDLDPRIILFLATAANAIVQFIKGRLPESDPDSDKMAARDWIPIILLPATTAVGCLMAAYYGRDLVAGAFEGFFAGASAVGIYELGSRIPGLDKLFTSPGWFR